MLKKHLKFIEMSGMTGIYTSSKFSDGKTKNASAAFVCLFVYLPGLFSGFFGFEWSIFMWIILFMISSNMGFMSKGISRGSKVLPVKDSFVVSNILFVYPVVFFICAAVVLTLFLSIIMGGLFAVIFGDSFIESAAEVLTIRGVDIMQVFFDVCLVAGIWFIVSVQSFYKNESRRIIGYVIILIICFMGIIAESALMKSVGVKSEYGISEVIYVLPEIPCVAGAAAFAIILGIYAWKRCLFLYRHDVAGQANMHTISDSFEELSKADKVLSSDEAKKARIFAVVGSFIVFFIIIGFFVWIFGDGSFPGSSAQDGGTGEIHIETDKVSEYGDWTSYMEKEKIPEQVYFLFDEVNRQTIFPDEINEDYITEYYALVDGKYRYNIYGDNEEYGPSSDGSWDGKVARFMVADYQKEDFRKECYRISKLSNTIEKYDGDVTNHIFVDEDNFIGTTYIAVYCAEYNDYEYAIADEDTGRIIYVYLNECEDIPTDVEYRAKKFSNVVPITMRNYGKGYSIYQ